MPKVPAKTARCPHCHSPRVVRLPHASDASTETDYYRCGSCGHIWTVPKESDGKQRVA